MSTLRGKPSVWVVILNWNGLDDTLVCLESLSFAGLSRIETRIIVVDNASRCDPRPAIKRRFPSVDVARMDRNTGFAGGCNHGIARAISADADYVLLLNNDTVVDPAFLAPLVDYARDNPATGVIGPLICNLDQPNRVSSAGATVDLAFGRVRIHYFGQDRSRVPSLPYATEFVTGCCMLIPTRVITTVGMLEEALFAYYDDVDYCLRVRKSRLSIACVPGSLIWHRESSTTRRGLAEGTVSPLKHYLLVRNRIAVVRRHGTLLQNIFFFFLVSPSLALYYTLAFLVRRRWTKLWWFWRGVRDGLQGRLGAPPVGYSR